MAAINKIRLVHRFAWFMLNACRSRKLSAYGSLVRERFNTFSLPPWLENIVCTSDGRDATFYWEGYLSNTTHRTGAPPERIGSGSVPVGMSSEEARRFSVRRRSRRLLSGSGSQRPGKLCMQRNTGV